MQGGPPPPGTTPTCDSAGILGPIVNVIASYQAVEALKLLSGNRAAINRDLTVFDMWDNRIRQVKLDGLLASTDCPSCKQGERPWLTGQRGSHTAVLCGRNAVQLSFPEQEALSLPQLEEKLTGLGQVTRNQYLLRAEIEAYRITVFPDGRAIIGGTDDISGSKDRLRPLHRQLTAAVLLVCRPKFSVLKFLGNFIGHGTNQDYQTNDGKFECRRDSQQVNGVIEHKHDCGANDHTGNRPFTTTKTATTEHGRCNSHTVHRNFHGWPAGWSFHPVRRGFHQFLRKHCK